MGDANRQRHARVFVCELLACILCVVFVMVGVQPPAARGTGSERSLFPCARFLFSSARAGIELVHAGI